MIKLLDDDAPVPSRAHRIIGIGASAGGLEACIAFFAHMPPDSGMAFVLVQHLDPQHASRLPELLAPHTRMPVCFAVDGVTVLPNHVYVAPPQGVLTIRQGVLALGTPAEIDGHRMPINAFFQSLAADQGTHAIGIVLSGLGDDGTRGLQAIRAHGGLTVAQAPETAAFAAMPLSAIAQGIDYQVPIAQMSVLLRDAHDRAAYQPLLAVNDGAQSATAAQLAAICSILQRETGHDFTHYKEGTLLRRIARRMQLMRIAAVDAYIERLANDRQEVADLLRDLLISVTHFFRDPDALAVLGRDVIPQLVRAKDAETPLRIWVPGCASGEDAYSVAMLVAEHMALLSEPSPVRVFGTDIDASALQRARKGHYDAGIATHVTPTRLAQFFVRQGRHYQVTAALREACIFATHNLISDPPFVRMDLIVCRNLLIYFDAEVQQQIIPLLHYALVPQGYLFIGPAESLASSQALFRPVDAHHRIFQRNDIVLRPRIDFSLVASPTRQLPPVAVPQQAVPDAAVLRTLLERVLLEQHTPPAVVINAQRTIVYFSGRTSTFLQPPTGTPTLDIVAMVHPDLRLALHTAIHMSMERQEQVVCEQLVVALDNSLQPLTLIVQPLPELGREAGLLLVIFQSVGPPLNTVQAQAAGVLRHAPEPVAEQLAQELQATRLVLERTIADLQDTNAEFRASNEELLAINEELQSAKEETQSINEELHTVNAELNRSLAERDQVNADLQNLFASTQIPAIFLTSDARITRFTPAATGVFHLIETDVGRPLSDIVPKFSGGAVLELMRTVLHTQTPTTTPVRQVGGDTWWVMHIRPYVTVANQIDGVVITFADISALKRAEAERERLLSTVQHAQRFAERIIESVHEPLLVLTADLRVRTANRAFYQMFGLAPADLDQQLLSDIGDGQWNIPALWAPLDALCTYNTPFTDLEVQLQVPHAGDKALLLNGHQAMQAPDDPALVLLSIVDITELRQTVTALQQAHVVLEDRVQARTTALEQTNAALQAEIQARTQIEQARQLLLEQLVTAQEEERRHIARELHDQMGQDVTALLLGLNALQDSLSANEAAWNQAEQIQALARQIGKEVHTLAVQLRPTALDDLGLAITLDTYVEQWSIRAQVAVDLHSIGIANVRLPLAVETTVYRLVQEALTNVLKHAQATCVSLIIERRTDALHLIVEDDGVGFDAEAARSAQGTHGLGLLGMCERVAQLGGTVSIESAVGSGTTLFVHLPIAEVVNLDG